MLDRVTREESRYDRQCQDELLTTLSARHLAEDEFNAGELDDWLDDYVVDCPTAFTDIVKAVINGIDTGDMELALSRVASEIRDVRAVYAWIIDERAKVLRS